MLSESAQGYSGRLSNKKTVMEAKGIIITKQAKNAINEFIISERSSCGP